MKLSKASVLAVLALVASCQIKEPFNPETINVVASREATSNDSKTFISDGGAVLWAPEDSIRIFRGSNSEKFVYEGTEACAVASFTGKLPAGSQTDKFWAISPFDGADSFDGSAIYLTVPTFQQATANTFDPSAASSLAVAEPVLSGTLSLSFKNICGGVKFTLGRSDIVRVVFSSNNKESISGSVKVVLDANDKPYVDKVLEGRDSIVMVLPDEAAFSADTAYYISALPASLTGGFTMTFYTQNMMGSRTSTKSVDLTRSVFGNVGQADEGVTFVDIPGTVPVITIANTLEVDYKGAYDESIGVTLKDDFGWTPSVSYTGCVDAAYYYAEESAVYYTVQENASEDAAKGTIVFTLSKTGKEDVSATVNVSQAGKPVQPQGSEYVKVTKALTDWSGVYLVVASGQAASGVVQSGWGKSINVTVVNGKIARTDATKACEATLDKISGDKYALHFANGNYLGSSDSNSGIQTTTATPGNTDPEFLWTPTQESDSVKLVLPNVKSRFLCFNTSGFRAYKSASGKTASLYRCDSSGSDTLFIKTDSKAESITQTSAVLKGSYKSQSTVPSEVGIKYGTDKTSLDQTAVAAVTGNQGDFSVTLSGLKPGTTYFYQAHMLVGKKSYVGNVENFTTESQITPPDPSLKADYGWFELPAQKDKNMDGIDDDNPDYYYSHTFRADAGSIRNFSCCYSKSKIHPVWVAAPMHKCYMGSSGRNDSYKADPNIKCVQNGKFDGYTRGHMIGSYERTVSVATNRQVFYYSNIGAQLSSGFNTGGGAWNNLESVVDEQYCSDTLYQVIGCIFEQWTDRYGKTVSKRTASGSDIPTAYYKVLLRTKAGNSGKRVDQCTSSELKCCAFILAHTGNQSHKPCDQDMYSVSDVEKLTGLTFFVNVPNAPKTTYTASDWGL